MPIVEILVTGDPVACEPAPEATGAGAALMLFMKALCSRRRVEWKSAYATGMLPSLMIGISVPNDLAAFEPISKANTSEPLMLIVRNRKALWRTGLSLKPASEEFCGSWFDILAISRLDRADKLSSRLTGASNRQPPTQETVHRSSSPAIFPCGHPGSEHSRAEGWA